MKRLLASIFIDFGLILEPSCPSKTEPRRSKIDVEKALKFNQFLKASWSVIFSAQEAQGTRTRAKFEAARWNAQPPGEDFGGGRQNLREEESGKKNPETPGQRSSTPTPVGGGSLRTLRRAV